MNVFNRAVVIVVLLALIAFLIVTAIFPYTVVERVLNTAQAARAALEGRWTNYLLFLLVDVVVLLLLAVLLWLETRPAPQKTVTVRNVSGARAVVSTSSVEQSLQYRISEIADVLKVRPTVHGKRGGVDILLDLETTPEIDVPAKTAEIAQAARDVVEGKMGLKVSHIKVHIKHGPYGKAKAPAAQPVAAPSVAAEPSSGSMAEQPTPPAQAEEGNPYSQP
jgi:hypothetical protein